MSVSLDRAEQVLQYCNENGETETCHHFNINIESLHRYQRKAKFYETKQPKVLLFDIETTPLTVKTWHTGKQRISFDQIMDEWFLLSYSGKWLFDSKVFGSVLTPDEAIHKDDLRITKEIWNYFNQADVIIAHNGNGFDIPKSQTRFLMHKLVPPSPFQTIDTLLIARKNFRLSSNKLDYIGQLMLNERKLHTEYSLWLRCLEGDPQALSDMLTYNKQDVLLLEDIYVLLRPWIKSHPNMAIFMEAHEPSCPNCGSTDIKECGYYTTSVNRFLAFRCNSCGAVCRSRKSDVPLKCKSGIMQSVAR